MKRRKYKRASVINKATRGGWWSYKVSEFSPSRSKINGKSEHTFWIEIMRQLLNIKNISIFYTLLKLNDRSQDEIMKWHIGTRGPCDVAVHNYTIHAVTHKMHNKIYWKTLEKSNNQNRSANKPFFLREIMGPKSRYFVSLFRLTFCLFALMKSKKIMFKSCLIISI